MYLFGGNNYSKTVILADPNDENSDKSYIPLFQLNMKTFAWHSVRTRGEVKPRDEHSCVLDENNG